MKLTKEDYMRLPKERLAELLEQLDNEMEEIDFAPNTAPYKPSGWLCDGSVCTNPNMDCVNCPNRFNAIVATARFNTGN